MPGLVETTGCWSAQVSARLFRCLNPIRVPVRVVILTAALLTGGNALQATAQQATAQQATTQQGTAQDSSTTPSGAAGSKSVPPKAATPAPAAGQPASTARDTVFFLQDGQIVELPAGRTVEQFMRWLEQQSKPGGDGLPDFYIASVALDGRVDPARQKAQLDAVFDIIVQREKTTVAVPLRLTEATLLKKEYSGTGTLDFLPGDRGTGLNLRLTGKGQHRVRLQISVPIKQSGGAQRLQLALPASAQNSLRLVVPEEELTLRSESLADVETKPLAGSESAIVAYGLNEQLDLSWQAVLPARRAEATELQSQTIIVADIATDGTLLDVAQTVIASRGSFDKLTVELPPGFAIESLTCPSHPGMQFADPQFNRVPITLGSSTTGPVELRWSLASQTIAEGDSIELNSLPVLGAARAETLLGVSVVEGYRIDTIEERTRDAQRIGVTSFRRRAESSLKPSRELLQAWRLAGDHPAAAFKLERIAPGYRVNSSYKLHFGETAAELTARFEVQVFRGSLDEIDLKWPNFASQNWQQIETTDDSVPVEIGLSASPAEDAAADPDRIRLTLNEAKNRTHKRWQIELTCRRSIDPSDTGFALSLPGTAIEQPLTSSLQVTNDAQIESQLEPAAGSRMRLVADPEATEAATALAGPLQDLPDNQQPGFWQIDSPPLQFNARVMTYSQTIRVEPSAVISVGEEQVTVAQTFDYAVAYEPISTLRFNVPESVPKTGGLKFTLFDPVLKQRSELEPLETGLPGQVRVELPKRLWRFKLQTEYVAAVRNELSSDAESEFVTPLLQSSDAPTEATQIEVRSPGNVEVRIDDPLWRSELAIGDSPSWSAIGAQPEVTLLLQLSPEKASENFSIARAVLQTRCEPIGSRTSAYYLIEGSISFLTVGLPTSTDPASLGVWWDGRKLSSDRIRFSNSDQLSVRLDVDLEEPQLSDRHILAFDFAALQEMEFGPLNRTTLRAPEFASDVWTAETLWDVVLPYDQHLFVYPENYSPQFRWQRRAVIWSRRTIDDAFSLDSWLAAGELPDATGTGSAPVAASSLIPFDLTGQPDGNQYRFSSFGHQAAIEVQTMSQPAIFLGGAGLSLAVGFILLRIPATRNLLTFLLIGFVMAVFGLWHLEAVQLLAQPALLGLLAAVAAAINESRVRKRERAALVTFSTPSDFLTPGSSREEAVANEVAAYAMQDEAS